MEDVLTAYITMEDVLTAYIILGNVRKKNPTLRRILSDRNSMRQYIVNYFMELKLQLHVNIRNVLPSFI